MIVKLRMIVSEEFWKVQIPDVLLKRYLFLIGEYSEMLFSGYTGTTVCVCRSSENRKRTKCQMYIFNMIVLSVNPTSERDFWLPQKNISGGRLSKELTIRYYYNNKVEGSTVWVDPNRSNSLWTSENTSHHSNKSRVLHALEVCALGGVYLRRGGPPTSH